MPPGLDGWRRSAPRRAEAEREPCGVAGLGGEGDTMRLTLPAPGDRWVDVWVAIGPGDDPRPVLTVLLEGED